MRTRAKQIKQEHYDIINESRGVWPEQRFFGTAHAKAFREVDDVKIEIKEVKKPKSRCVIS